MERNSKLKEMRGAAASAKQDATSNGPAHRDEYRAMVRRQSSCSQKERPGRRSERDRRSKGASASASRVSAASTPMPEDDEIAY